MLYLVLWAKRLPVSLAAYVVAVPRTRAATAGYGRFRGRSVFIPSPAALVTRLTRPGNLRKAQAAYRLAQLYWAAQVMREIAGHYCAAVGVSQREYAPFRLLDQIEGPPSPGEVERLLHLAIEKDPHFAEAHFFLAQVRAEAGDDQRAVADLRVALRSAPRLPQDRLDAPPNIHALVLLGDCLMRLGKTSEGVAAYRRATRLFPRLSTPHEGLGRAALQQDDFASASLHFLASYRPTHFVPTQPRLPRIESYNEVVRSLRDLTSSPVQSPAAT